MVTEEKHSKFIQRESPNPLLFLSNLPEESVLALTCSSVTTLCFVSYGVQRQMEQARGSAHKTCRVLLRGEGKDPELP